MSRRELVENFKVECQELIRQMYSTLSLMGEQKDPSFEQLSPFYQSVFRSAHQLAGIATTLTTYKKIYEYAFPLAEIFYQAHKMEYLLSKEQQEFFTSCVTIIEKILDDEQDLHDEEVYAKLLDKRDSFAVPNPFIMFSNVENIEVLLIESSVTEQIELSRKLENRGYIVHCVKRGDEALSFLEKNSPSLVLIEQFLPDITGLELCRKIKSLYSDLPVVFISIYTDPSIFIEVLIAGATSFLTKPYDDNYFASILYSILENEKQKKLKKHGKINFLYSREKFDLEKKPENTFEFLLSTFEDLMQKMWHLEQARKELYITNDIAQEAIKEKNYFLGYMSHEIRTPLTSIVSYLDVFAGELDKLDLSDQQKHFFKTIQKNTEYLIEIFTDVLDLTVIDSNQVKVICEPIELAFFLKEVDELLSLIAKKKMSRLTVYSNASIKEFFSHEIKLKQILINLISNAIKYSPDSSEVVVTAENDDNYIYFKVANEGEIDKSLREIIFDPYQRIVKPHSKEAGFGLGLSIAKKLTTLLGGSIDVSCKEGSTLFQVSLPLTHEDS